LPLTTPTTTISPTQGLALGAKRFQDLVALSERRLSDAFGGRIARLYGWGIAGSYGLALFLVSSRAETILSQALVALSWIPAGLVALGAARDQARLDDENGFVALVRQRGFDARDLELARFYAAALRLARITGWPALALVLLHATRARGLDTLLAAGFSALGAGVYVLCLSVLLAALARASAIISGGRGRVTLVALILVPHLARALFPSLPSVPGMLGNILRIFFERGAG
jgi:hypothetical protein